MGYPNHFLIRRAVSGRCLLFASHHRPTLELRDRPVLLDPNHVADLELVFLVVRVIFLRAADHLSEYWMGETAFDPYHQGLVLLVAHHDALQAALRHFVLFSSSVCAFAGRWSSIGQCHDALRAPARYFPIVLWRAESAG